MRRHIIARNDPDFLISRVGNLVKSEAMLAELQSLSCLERMEGQRRIGDIGVKTHHHFLFDHPIRCGRGNTCGAAKSRHFAKRVVEWVRCETKPEHARENAQ